MIKILESVKFVVDNSKYVTINQDNVKKFIEGFRSGDIKTFSADDLLSKAEKLSQKDLLHLVLIFNSVSFSYWPDNGDPKWQISYMGQNIDGAYAMMISIMVALENGYQITDPSYLSNISEKDWDLILKGNTRIPLFYERLNILREIGSVLEKKYESDFSNMIREADGDVQKLLGIIINNFPNFKDETEYKGKKVYFYKRAQLLISDISKILKNTELGKFHNLNNLTAGADYKIPMILRRLGILEYSDKLSEKIDNKIQIPKDSEEEIEIRAATIWAIEEIKLGLIEEKSIIDTIDLHYHFWVMSQTPDPRDKPYHLSRSIYY